MADQDPSPTPAAPLVVGWRERVDLPDWGLRRVRAKIDTGARTSAIDVATIEELPGGRIRFEVVSLVRPVRRTRWVEATPVRRAVVRPSHGESQERPVCLTRIRLGSVEREVEVSLVCRAGMLCRMLLGRTAIEGAALVDPGRKYLQTPGRRATEAKEVRP
jgi:hypothetical protein